MGENRGGHKLTQCVLDKSTPSRDLQSSPASTGYELLMRKETVFETGNKYSAMLKLRYRGNEKARVVGCAEYGSRIQVVFKLHSMDVVTFDVLFDWLS